MSTRESEENEELAEIYAYGETVNFWWEASEKSIAARASERAQTIATQNYAIYQQMRMFSYMYDGRSPVWFDETGMNGMNEMVTLYNRVMSETGAVPKQNLAATVIDALSAMIVKQRPLPRAMTRNGDWEDQRTALVLNNCIKGTFPDCGIYEVAPEIVIDTLVCGTGAVRLLEGDKKAIARRLIPWQVLVDPQICLDGNEPDEVFIRSLVSVKSLCKQYPDLKEDIMKAPRVSSQGRGTQVLVYEGWYTGEDTSVYIKCLGNILLETETFEKRLVPIEFLFYQKPRTGFYGVGLVEKLMAQQLRIDEIETFIAEMQRRHMRPIMAVDQAQGISKVVRITDLDMDILETPGARPPTVFVPQPVSPDLYRQVDRIVDRSMQETGVSDFSTNSKIPNGVESGPAMREVSFKNQDRHNQFAMRYEELFIRMGHQIIEAYDRMNRSSRKKIRVNYRAKGMMCEEEWPDLKDKDLKYILTIEASSLDTLSPSFRTQTVLEWAQQKKRARYLNRRAGLAVHPTCAAIGGRLSGHVTGTLPVVSGWTRRPHIVR